MWEESRIPKNEKEVLRKIKHDVKNEEYLFMGLLVDMAEERISGIEDLSVVTLKTEKQREQRP